jgi:hypothetical protein
MREIIKYVLGIFGGIVVVGMSFYAIICFFMWLFSDPFNWIEDTPPPPTVQSVYQKFSEECKSKGGIPTLNPWGADKCIFPPSQN